jgi:hypothetical protein
MLYQLQHLVSSETPQPSIQFQYASAGAPARTVGWRHPGYIHTSYLKDLWPDSMYVIFLSCLNPSEIRTDPVSKQTWLLQHYRYTYRLGHRLPNGTRIWSKSYNFKASPYPGQDSLQRVVIFGDMGKVTCSSIYILVLFI